MPEAPLTPGRPQLEVDPNSVATPEPAPFVELGLLSCFSFLQGASLPVKLVETAWALGYHAIGIADANSMAGVVRAHTSAKALKLTPVIGCRIETVEGLTFLAYPTDRAAYGRLCRLISAGRMNTLDGEWQAKGACDISLPMLAEHAEGVQLILLPPAGLDAEFAIEIESNVIPFPSSSEDGRKSGGDAAHIAREATIVPRQHHPQSPLLKRRGLFTAPFEKILPHLTAQLPTLRHLAASYLYTGDDIARIDRLDALAKTNGMALLATNDVHYHLPDRRPLQDVMTAIRHKTTVAAAGHLLLANAERHLKSPGEMIALFARWPHAIAASREVADACRFSLDELKYEYPRESYPDGLSAQQYLERLTWQGAAAHYTGGIPTRVRETLEKEFALIEKKALAQYFLTIKSIVDFARSQDPPILCQGRGSAANSAVCFCLGVTAVDPSENELLFERFISADSDVPPDIDVDFEHERREEVIQHIYKTYGRDHAGLCATVIHYRPRMAIREVGKAMGLTEDVTAVLARTVWGGHGHDIDPAHILNETGLDLSDPHLKRVLALTRQMIDMPRHLSQHVGGFILTQGALTETVPIGNGAMPERSFIEWDKDDIDDLRILKIDILALGMLTCIRKALDLLKDHHRADYQLATIPKEDPAVYDMLCAGDSLGVFQVESRAQMNMLPRLRPRELYDLVVQVAIVRPGPIQGDMVHPYLKARRERRAGKRDFHIPGPAPGLGPPDELSSILGRTFGVPIFQEQAMKIALDAAKFGSRDATRLRKAMATFRSRGMVHELQDLMVGNMIARGYDPEFAERCFNQIKGFGEYGFPESHAASFALLVYASAWLKCRYPDAFCAALLNAQPMGFYSSSQIVRDAREHGVEVRAPDVNFSDWDSTLAPGSPTAERLHELHREMRGDIRATHAVRLGLREIKGLSEEDGRLIVARRSTSSCPALGRASTSSFLVQEGVDGRDKPGHDSFVGYDSVRDVWLRTGLQTRVLERLADADAFGSLGLTRRDALWAAKALGRVGDRDDDLPLFATSSITAAQIVAREPDIALPPMPLGEEVVNDYRFLRLSLKAHPAQFLRADLDARGVVRNEKLRTITNGAWVKISGLVTCRQRPGSANGVVFMTIEDETAVANAIVWPKVFERVRPVVLGARFVTIAGRMQKESEVIHVVAEQLDDLTFLLVRLAQGGDDIGALARCDEVRRPVNELREHQSTGGRPSRLARLLQEMPELAADLDVPARGSAHTPTRKAG
jgi:error-prone DNA polymerase